MVKIDDENVSNHSGNPAFAQVVEARVSRRGFLGGGLAAAAAFSLSGVDALLRAVPASAKANGGPLLGFEGIDVSTADTVVVPRGLRRACSSRGVTRCPRGRLSNKMRATALPNRRCNGACTTTAWCTSRFVARDMACSCRTTSIPTTCCCSPMALPIGMQRRLTSRSMPTAFPSSRSPSVAVMTTMMMTMTAAGAAVGAGIVDGACCVRPLRITARASMDSDRCFGEHDQHRSLCWLRQQPDGVRRPSHRGDPAIPRRSEAVK